EALGFAIASATPVVIESVGVTSLVQLGNNYFLYTVGTSSGPSLKYSGAVVTVGQFGGWTPIAGEKTASGDDVAWKFWGAEQYLGWGTDGSGNYTGGVLGVVSGTSSALENFEPIFQQDLNGDG